MDLETLKQLEGKTGETFQNIGIGNAFLDRIHNLKKPKQKSQRFIAN
jgi:hypothetical protein